MKVAVYSISKNEEQFVERWAESAKDADMILLADTGSTDNTVQIAKDLGINVIEIKVKPWRFDVARNKSLHAIPQDYDYCIALDLDDRNAHYYARELLIYKRYDEAKAEFLRHLSLPTAVWKPERSNSYRYLASCTQDHDERVEWLFKAIAEYPEGREAWVSLAEEYYRVEDWHGCYFAAKKALDITEKPMLYFNEAWAWNGFVYDIGSIAAYKLGQDKDAFEWGTKALEFEPDNPRIIANLEYYKEALDG